MIRGFREEFDFSPQGVIKEYYTFLFMNTF